MVVEESGQRKESGKQVLSEECANTGTPKKPMINQVLLKQPGQVRKLSLQ